MKVSVVIPTYNRATLLAQAIQSVFDQSFQDYELIVVDDGSLDATAEVVARFGDKRLRYIRHRENRGYAAACNTCFANAEGELISILDSDDLWKPEKLSTEVSFLDGHPEVDAVFSDLEKRDSSVVVPSFMRETPRFSHRLKAERFPEGVVLTQREMYLCLLQEVPIKPTALTLRASALRSISGFDERFPSANDWDFLLRFSKLYRFGYIDKPLATLRVQHDATHRLHAERNHLFVLEFLRSQRKLLKNDPEAYRAVQWGIADTTNYLAWHYLACGNKVSAIKRFLFGFQETRDWALVARAIAAALPPGARRCAKSLLGRKGR